MCFFCFYYTLYLLLFLLFRSCLLERASCCRSIFAQVILYTSAVFDFIPIAGASLQIVSFYDVGFVTQLA
ncbi:hypothetical protein C8N40_110107 [Pontibacter mucosus]|uniref:Uncharacterized protein n=1 Tax=Pontibacter mucosus TaxID=1649266 RepID=A0A2T5YDP9_9BACT|nr:hypothetical protein C8N40_110107 [Pontibacter mucosus]